MFNSWLEQIRFPLQSIEVLENAVVSQMLAVLDNPKEKSISQHKIYNFAQMAQQKSKNILNFMKEQSAMKKDQLAVIQGYKGQNGLQKKKSNEVMWQNFYQKAREIKDYYKKNESTIPLTQAQNSVQFFRRVVFMPPFKQPEFSSQENKGKFVDMHNIYLDYLNIYKTIEQKQGLKLHDYLWFLQNLDKFDDFPLNKKIKHQHKYMNYLNSLIEYFSSFISKSRPLFDTNQFMENVQQIFNTKFDQGKLPGWQPQHDGLQDQSQWQYCNYCEKLFIRNNAYIEHLSGKNHKKHLKAKQQINMDDPKVAEGIQEAQVKGKQQYRKNHINRKKVIALAEFKVMRMRQQLANTIYDTMNLIRKKQTRGYEDVDQFINQSSESEEADAPIYNPKNLPLGWDGKPIPYWLYKLHGLGIQYKCQICGNYSYWGRRAFQTHFQEWRHNYGMKCLKIPNTIHFKDVTSITDALTLHDKLIKQSQQSQFRPDMQQQFEDNQGNILNKRTYLDMKKQGLIDY